MVAPDAHAGRQGRGAPRGRRGHRRHGRGDPDVCATIPVHAPAPHRSRAARPGGLAAALAAVIAAALAGGCVVDRPARLWDPGQQYEGIGRPGATFLFDAR